MADELKQQYLDPISEFVTKDELRAFVSSYMTNLNAPIRMQSQSMQSAGFTSGTSGNGWKIDGQGNCEFNNGNFRGDITGASGTFSGTLSATSGLIGGWNIGATTLSATGISLDSGNKKITLGSSEELVLDGTNKRIRSSNYVAGDSGFSLDSDLLEVGNIVARGAIKTSNFIKGNITSVGGHIMISKGSDTLDVDMTALDSSTLTIKGNDTFAVNDILRMKEDTDDEWFQVTNIASAPTYTVTRDKALVYSANTNPAWKKGATVINYGQSGQGFIEMAAAETNSPWMKVETHAGSPWSTVTTRLRIGNLNGYLGYSSNVYGIGIGDSTNYLKYEPSTGFTLAGSYNTLNGNLFLGNNAGISRTTGNNNTFLGEGSGYSNTTGYNNVFLGFNSGYSNTTINYLVFIGHGSGYSNTTGYSNTFIGYSSGYSNIEGYRNTFLGYGSGYTNTTGDNNTFLGYNAGYSNGSNYNTFIGSSSGNSNTEGYNNTFLGYSSGYANTTGYYNTFIGYSAGTSNTTGDQNTFLGESSGLYNITGNGNVFLGYSAGYYETGSDKLFIDDRQRANEADGRTKALIYGIFNASTANQKVTINGLFNQSVSKTPASATATGTAGDICWDASYIYVCTATDTWKRVGIATW